jgi:cbb3-type cytochrome oxidase maturation protein
VSIAYLLVVLGLGVFALAIWALFWAVDSGQYEDLERQGSAILDEEQRGNAPVIQGARGASDCPQPQAIGSRAI